MEKRWVIRSQASSGELRGLSKYAPPVRRVLWARGVGSDLQAQDFFAPSAGERESRIPLKGLLGAVDRASRAIQRGERIVIFGDYDADGMCACALLTIALDRLGGDVHHYIPDRFDEGYGLNQVAVQMIAAGGAGLLITVDCGIRAVSEARSASEAGLDLIITDHHFPGPELPAVTAIVNPNQPGCPYPFKRLAGVGLAYKLACAVSNEMGRPGPEDLLDLVAIGTVADVTPLVDENRRLVRRGLDRINSSPRPGIRALAAVAGTEIGHVSSTSIGFRLAPRINAAGRLGETETAYQLLIADDHHDAEQLAGSLDELNRKRQSLTREAVERATGPALRTGPDSGILVAVSPDFHEGVVGLAASRLVEEYYRPAVVAKLDGDVIVGSCRSIPEFHITEALQEASELLTRFGGHAAAAGFRMNGDDLDSFIKRLLETTRELREGDDLKPELIIDTIVELPELTDRVVDELDGFEPCGHGNPQPLFESHAVRVKGKRTVGAGGSHLKMTVEQGGRYFDTIGFRLGSKSKEIGTEADIAFHLTRNRHLGVVTNQLQIEDIRPASSGISASPSTGT